MIQWNLTHPPLPGTVITHYRIQYRLVDKVEEGDKEGNIEQVDASQGWVFVDELEDAQSYEVCIMCVQNLLVG